MNARKGQELSSNQMMLRRERALLSTIVFCPLPNDNVNSITAAVLRDVQLRMTMCYARVTMDLNSI